MTKVQKILSDQDFNKIEVKTKLFESDDFEDSLTEDNEINDGSFNDEPVEDVNLTDEELKIESLKIATNIAKLLKDITAQDIVTIAGTVSSFIRNYEIEGANGSNMM